MPKFEIVRANRPVKRRAEGPLDDDPLVRAKAIYIKTRISLQKLAEEFAGQPGCGLANLKKRSANEDWAEERERHYDRAVADAASSLGVDQSERNKVHLTSARNSIVTLDKILHGIHTAVTRVLEDQEAKRITAAQAIGFLRALSTAARNIAIGQVGSIMLEQKLASSEGSSFQRLADAAEAKWKEVVDRRNELVKRAEQAASALEAEKKGARGRAGKGKP